MQIELIKHLEKRGFVYNFKNGNFEVVDFRGKRGHKITIAFPENKTRLLYEINAQQMECVLYNNPKTFEEAATDILVFIEEAAKNPRYKTNNH